MPEVSIVEIANESFANGLEMKKINPKVAAMAKAFYAAKIAGLRAFTHDDGGTCNFDSPACCVPRVSDKQVQAAAELAGVRASDFRWFGGKRWYWIDGFLNGQGNCRSRMSTAATKALRENAPEFMHVCEYCQMD